MGEIWNPVTWGRAMWVDAGDVDPATAQGSAGLAEVVHTPLPSANPPAMLRGLRSSSHLRQWESHSASSLSPL